MSDGSTDESRGSSVPSVGQLRTYLGQMGSTWFAGGIAAGPATMASLIVAGASFGYTLLWIVVLSAVLDAFSQYLAARLGLLTEAGIVSVVEMHLGSRWAWLLVADTVLAAGLAHLVIMKMVADVSATITGVAPEYRVSSGPSSSPSGWRAAAIASPRTVPKYSSPSLWLPFSFRCTV